MTFVNRNPKALVCLLVLPLAATTMGCGTSATLSTRYGADIHGTIVASTTDEIVYELSSNTKDRIARADVTDIDHPGNVAATIGGVVFAYGVTNIVIGAPNCDRNGAAYCVGVFLPAVIGGSLFAYGIGTWIESKRAAEPPLGDTKSARFFVAPAASFQKNNEYIGANAVVNF